MTKKKRRRKKPHEPTRPANKGNAAWQALSDEDRSWYQMKQGKARLQPEDVLVSPGPWIKLD